MLSTVSTTSTSTSLARAPDDILSEVLMSLLRCFDSNVRRMVGEIVMELALSTQMRTANNMTAWCFLSDPLDPDPPDPPGRKSRFQVTS